MFEKLKKKIMLYILLTTILFTTIMSIISFYFVSNSILNNFKYSVNENINQSIKNSLFSIEAARNSTIQISQNTGIIDAITENEYHYSVNPILNTLKNTSYGILGVTLYTTNQIVYNTSSVSSYPSFSEILENDTMSQFIQSEDTIYLSIRTSTITDIYNYVRYDPQYGMISYIVKLYDESNNICGYLFVDINPSFIYNQFFNYKNYKNFKNVETFIISQDNTYLKSERNSEKLAKYLPQIKDQETKVSKDHKYLLISKPYINDTTIITMVPMKPFYQNILWIGIGFITTSAILILIAYYIGSKLTQNITLSLNHLYQKMQDTDLKQPD